MSTHTQRDCADPYALGLAAWEYLLQQHRLSSAKTTGQCSVLVQDAAGNHIASGETIEAEVETFDPILFFSRVTRDEFDAALAVVQARL